MNQKIFRNRCLKIILALLVIAATAGISSAETFYLKADVTSKTMPGTGEIVPMWGYAQCNATFTTCGGILVPGPELTVPVGDSTLIINLKNNLPVPTSVIIPGLIVAMSPKWDDSATGSRTSGDYTARVMSFNTETAAGGTGNYTWNNVPPGTRLYESGTNPAVQIQMGLYGAVKKDFAAGQAYSDASTQYNSEKVMLFSAVDPAFNTAVATGNYSGIPASIPPVPGTLVTSAIDYKPKYFLINGNAYSAVLPNIQIAAPALFRFLNAGLQTYVPIIQGTYMSIFAEDGNLLPYKKEQYSLILPSGKTMDAILKPTATGIYPLYDRRLNMTNAALSPGGMLVKIEATSVPVTVTAVNDGYNVAQNTTLNVPAPGVLGNDSASDGSPLTAIPVSGVLHGALTRNANGSFSYTPTTNYLGPDSFTYRATNGTVNSDVATVNLMVNLTYNISGRVLTASGTPIAGVTMTLSGAADAVVTTNAKGKYSFTRLLNGNYTVTPSQAGRTFNPISRAVTVNGANVTGQKFTRN